MTRWIVKGIDTVSLKIGHIASYTMLVLIISASIEIVCRYFFNSPTKWAYELGQMIFGSYFLLAGAMTLRDRDHVGMELVLDKLTPRGKAVMNAITVIFRPSSAWC
jgi:TRAP-type mannitol/chloroaromatic compound transport system permease small subunit